MRPLSFVACLLAGCLLGPALALADPQGKSDAETLLRRGLDLRRAHRDEEALTCFRRAFALSPSARARAQIGFAEQALGAWQQAEKDLQAALAEPLDPWVRKQKDALQEALHAVSERLGTLELRGGPPGAAVRVNSEPVGHLPLPALRVPAGSAAIEVSLERHLPLLLTLLITPRGVHREQITLVAAPRSGRVHLFAADRPRPNARALRISGALLSAAGLGLLGAGTGGALLREQAAARWNDDACVQNGLSRFDNCGDALRDADSMRGLLLAGTIGGGALLLGGVTLLAISYQRIRERTQ